MKWLDWWSLEGYIRLMSSDHLCSMWLQLCTAELAKLLQVQALGSLDVLMTGGGAGGFKSTLPQTAFPPDIQNFFFFLWAEFARHLLTPLHSFANPAYNECSSARKSDPTVSLWIVSAHAKGLISDSVSVFHWMSKVLNSWLSRFCL